MAPILSIEEIEMNKAVRVAKSLVIVASMLLSGAALSVTCHT